MWAVLVDFLAKVWPLSGPKLGSGCKGFSLKILLGVVEPVLCASYLGALYLVGWANFRVENVKKSRGFKKSRNAQNQGFRSNNSQMF